jgi:hypothetical protein
MKKKSKPMKLLLLLRKWNKKPELPLRKLYLPWKELKLPLIV